MRGARAAFSANWLVTSRLGRRRVDRRDDRELSELGTPRYLSTVFRPPSDLAARLEAVAMPLGGLDPHSHVYPAATIHVTVLGLADGPGVADEVRAIAARHHAFEVELGGLNLSRRTVFAEAYPVGSDLARLRAELQAAVGALAPAWRRLPGGLAHANVLRFAPPVEPALVVGLRDHRRARLGRFTVKEIELVRTDKVLSEAGTQSLDRLRLGPS